MTSSSVSSVILASLWTNVAFAFILAFLMFALAYLYILPYHVSPNKNAPKSLRSLLFSTAVSLFVTCVLNVLYFAQGIPAAVNGGASFHIHNLKLSGWIAIMVFATITRAVPFPLLFMTFSVILESRWDTLIHLIIRKKFKASTENREHPFLGWHWKRKATHLQAFALVILPILSSITYAIGFSTSARVAAKDGNMDIYDLQTSEPVFKVALAFDGMRCFFVATSVLDISTSTFLLFKKLRATRYVDPIIDLNLLVFTPLLVILAVPTVLASSFHTVGTASALVLARVDFAGLLTTLIIIVVCIIALTILYNCPSWWALAMIVQPDEAFGGHELSKVATSQSLVSSEGLHS